MLSQGLVYLKRCWWLLNHLNLFVGVKLFRRAIAKPPFSVGLGLDVELVIKLEVQVAICTTIDTGVRQCADGRHIITSVDGLGVWVWDCGQAPLILFSYIIITLVYNTNISHRTVRS